MTPTVRLGWVAAVVLLLPAVVSADVGPRGQEQPLAPAEKEAIERKLAELLLGQKLLGDALNDPDRLADLLRQQQVRPPNLPPPGRLFPPGGPPFDPKPGLPPVPPAPDRPPRPDRPAPDVAPPKLPDGMKGLEDFFKNARPPDRPPAGAAGDPRLKNNPALRNLIRTWERNVGPLDDNPNLKKALTDFFTATANTEGGGLGGGDDFFSKLEREGGEAAAFTDWLDKNIDASKFRWPNLGLKDWGPKGSGSGFGNWNLGGPPDVSMPSAPSGGWGGFGGGAGGAWLPLVLLALAAAAYLAWRYWPAGGPTPAAEALGRWPGGWPVDPRTIADREELVKAFEYLSVLLCGDAARVWNHHTIAAALRQQVPGAELVADDLAHLYELARYTPPGDRLAEADLIRARRSLCHLAGVPAP